MERQPLFKRGDLITPIEDFVGDNEPFFRQGVLLLEVLHDQEAYSYYHEIPGPTFDKYIIDAYVIVANPNNTGAFRPGAKGRWWAGRFKLVSRGTSSI